MMHLIPSMSPIPASQFLGSAIKDLVLAACPMNRIVFVVYGDKIHDSRMCERNRIFGIGQ